MPESLLNEVDAEPGTLPSFWLLEKLLLCERENIVVVKREEEEKEEQNRTEQNKKRQK